MLAINRQMREQIILHTFEMYDLKFSINVRFAFLM